MGRFTALVREDHAREHDEGRAKAAAIAAEEAVERAFSELLRVILSRYHEEQAWSDKIRSASTYGSLAALALNLVVFAVATLLVEPWKRRRLAQTFERKVEQVGAETAAHFEEKTAALRARLDDQAGALAALVEAVHRVAQVEDAAHGPTAVARGSAQAREGEGEMGEEGLGARIPGSAQAGWRRDQELIVAASAGAVVAGLVSWAASSWFG